MSEYYTPTGSPATGSSGSSAVIRAEFDAIRAAMEKLPGLAGNGGLPAFVNAGGTALEAANIATAQTRLGIVVSNELNGLANLNAVGIIARTGNGAYASRTLTGTANQVTVTNGNGNAGNMTLSLPSNIVTPGGIASTGQADFNGGSGGGLVAFPAATIKNDRILVFSDAAGGTANCAFLWQDPSNVLRIGSTNGTAVTLTGGNIAFAAEASAVAGFRASGALVVAATSTSGFDFQPPAARVIAFGNSPANRGKFQVTIAGSDGSNALIPLTIDEFGNTALNNVNIAGKLTGTSSMLSPLNNSLAADVNLNNTSVFFVGPSVAQGNNGTWFASGVVTCKLVGGTDSYAVKLWDGTTVIAHATVPTVVSGQPASASLSGFITSPNGNIRISARPSSATNGNMVFNSVSGTAKDSTLTAVRIG